jgi:hypothetical protein
MHDVRRVPEFHETSEPLSERANEVAEALNAVGAPSERSTSVGPSREELFRLLTEEIKDINEAEKLTGWTPWVILASLLSASWILIQDLWSRNYSPRIVASVFLIVASGIILIRGAKRSLESFSESLPTRTPFTSLHSMTTANSVLANLLFDGSMGFACFELAPVSPNFKFFAGIYGVLLLFGLIGFVIILARIPIPVPRPSRAFSPIAGSIIFPLIYLGTIAQILRTGVAKSATVVDIRFGGVLALCAFAILFLTRSTSRLGDARYVLSEIRRNLVLCNISVTEARNNARMSLQGMWLSDVMSDDMRSLLKYISVARAEYSEALSKISAVRNNVQLDKLDAAWSSELDRVAVRSTLVP